MRGGTMAGLYTTELVEPNLLYSAVQDHVTSTNAHLHCYSRLPLRQLLRHLSAQNATAWWISEHPSAQSVQPTRDVILQHVLSQSVNENDVVLIESLDWLVARNGEDSILELIQQLDSESKANGYSILFALDPLSLSQRFWKRLRAIAPAYDVLNEHNVSESNHEEPPVEEINEIVEAVVDQEIPDIVHLVSIPRHGFNHTILARRMLQWKRMGFDLAELEPAMTMQDLDQAHGLYKSIEHTVTQAIDALRYLVSHESRLTVTERERTHYRLMNLIDIDETVKDLEHLISLR
jgi:hypothetical protein